MADVLFLVLVAAFFLLCVGYVRACDRIIGADQVGGEAAASASPDREVSVS
jgi:hypothetical protein